MQESCVVLDHHAHGKGAVIYEWNPNSQYIASVGSNGTVFIWHTNGKQKHAINLALRSVDGHSALEPDNGGPVTALNWSADGSWLAILQGARHIFVWDFQTYALEKLQLTREDPCYIKWSRQELTLVIGTLRGEILLFDYATKICVSSSAKCRKQIVCGDWNQQRKFAFASEDRQITIISEDGKMFGQMKVKTRPICIQFGGTVENHDTTVTVSMDKKTILLYNLDDPENALELAFQQRYGHIVAFHWLKSGFVMVGFSLGYLVIISTETNKIQREQFCACFHEESLYDVAYCPSRNMVATYGDSCVKIVDIETWKEFKVYQLNQSTYFEKLTCSNDGEFFCISSRDGSLHIYPISSSALQPLRDGKLEAVMDLVWSPFSTVSLIFTSVCVLLAIFMIFCIIMGAPFYDVLSVFALEFM